MTVKADGGGTKNDRADAKPRTDLVSPSLMIGAARVLAPGAEKYGERNWERGMKWSRPFGAAIRHMWAWFMGEDLDPETGLHHLWHAGCNLMFLAHYVQYPVYTQFDDRPIAHRPDEQAEPDPKTNMDDLTDVELIDELDARGVFWRGA